MRWTGFCHGCQRADVGVRTRYEHHAKTLCDTCTERLSVKLKTSSLYASDTLTAPRSLPLRTPAAEPNPGGLTTRTRTRTRTRDERNERRTRGGPQAVGSPQQRDDRKKSARELGLTDALLAEYRTGRLQPVRVRLPNVPTN